MTTSVEFFVPGIPVGQGSKTYVPTARGPRARESNEQKLKPWRASIIECAPSLEQPIDGPLAVRASFVFPRPKTHYRTGRHRDELKTNAPDYHVSTPDLDKLQRALGDALAGVIIANDSLIARWDCVKFYGDRPGAHVEITTLLESEL